MRSNSRSQSIVLIGIGMLVISAILLVFAFSAPRVSLSSASELSTTQQESEVESSYVVADGTTTNSYSSYSKSSNTSKSSSSNTTKAKSNTTTVTTTKTVKTATSAVSKAETTLQEQTTEATQSEDVVISYPLNLNTCTVDELTTIDGIGDSRASAIIQYREYIGGYTSVEQIKEIKGIGDSIYEKVAPYLTV